MKICAVLFDLDGTLIDSLEGLTMAANRCLADGGFPEHSEDALRGFIGNGARKLIERALPETARDEETVDGMLAAFGAAYAEAWKEGTRPYEGIPEMLAAVSAAGIPMGVLSNKPDGFTREIVAAVFAEGVFDVVAGAKSDVPLKPAPDAGHVIAEGWGLAPAEIAYVGDSTPDVRFAKAVGMPSVGVAWGFRGPEELRREEADVIVESVADLQGWLLERVSAG